MQKAAIYISLYRLIVDLSLNDVSSSSSFSSKGFALLVFNVGYTDDWALRTGGIGD
jgi:hypothetical protein